MKPFCFVLMPFDKKADETGRVIDFDRVYREIIRPAIEDGQLEPIRADEEMAGGFIHKPMFERLMLCDYAVADLSTANPNVLYELGIRHGIRPHSTVLMFAKGLRLPFDVKPLRGLPYELDLHGIPSNPAADRKALADRLLDCRNPIADSPLFQLIDDWPKPDIARLKTDTFREAIEYSRRYKEQLLKARNEGLDAIKEVERTLNIKDADPAIVIDLFLSYRGVEAWDAMVDLSTRMSPMLSKTILVREQMAFALNRLKKRDEAISLLNELISERGYSSETNGILGRVYKDLWQDAIAAGKGALAEGYLQKAIDTYTAGFEADWRDAYPGINAVTLMELQQPVDPRQKDLMPVVRYSVLRRLARTPDYWDYATLLELDVLAGDERGATKTLTHALAAVREKWEPKSTADNIALIHRARQHRDVDVSWIAKIEEELRKAGKGD